MANNAASCVQTQAPQAHNQLSENECQAVKQFLDVVNEMRQEHSAGPMSFNSAVKFMTARKFDIHRALSLYEAHEITRFREGLAKFDPLKDPLKTELESGKFTVLPTRDSSGAAIAMFTACKHNPIDSSHQLTLQGMVFQMDVALEDFETQKGGIVFIYNMLGSKYSNFDYELSQKILSILKGAYPARLKKVLIVCAPLWFKAPFKILRLFVREKLRDRVFMVSVPQLALHIPVSSLPKELGGHIDHEHRSWLNHCYKHIETTLNDLCDLAASNTNFTVLSNGSAILMSRNTNNGSLNSRNSSSQQSVSSSSSTTNHNHHNHNKSNSHNHSHEISDEDESGGSSAGQIHPSLNGFSERKATKPKPEMIQVPVSDEGINNSHNSTMDGRWSGGAGNEVPQPVVSDESLHNDDEGMSLEEFIQYLKSKGRKGLQGEYAEIKCQPPTGTFDISRQRSNQCKNRYTDVLSFDHSRVIVSLDEADPFSTDYINANFVDGYKQKNAFISTQGPLPKTFSDFWRMVWEQEVHVIVMTTRVVERGRPKCGQYWPQDEQQSLECGNFKLTNNGIEHYKDYIIASLVLTNTTTGTTREITHMQFCSWPDYGCPPSALAMLDFRDRVREEQAKAVSGLGTSWKGHPLGPPIVVHCSAGIGRTGTFITLDISILRLEDCGKIDIRRTVEKIRSQRAFSIQMPDQYVFCYLALLEYALSRGLLQDVDLSGFEEDDEESDFEE